MKFGFVLAALMALVSAARADISKLEPPDLRLVKKVTLEVNYVKLQEVADSLSKQSGIVIRAGSGDRDWKVRQQRVTIHAKDMPVGRLTEHIAQLLGFYVSREGKYKEWTYTIWQDKKSRDLEAEMLTAEHEAESQRIARQRQAGIDLANDALKMSPAEAMKKKDQNPLLAYLGGTKAGRGCAQLMSSFGDTFPTEYDLMMRGKRSYVPLSALPPNLQKALADATSGGLANALKAISGTNLSAYQLVMTPASDVLGSSLPGIIGMGMMVVTGLSPGQKPDPSDFLGGGNIMTLFPMMDGDSPLGKLAGRTLFNAEAGASLDALSGQLDAGVSEPGFAEGVLAHDSPTEKNPPTDSDLTREVEIKDVLTGVKKGASREERLGLVMAEASRATGWPVLLESFKNPKSLGSYVHPGKQPLYKVLIGIEKAGYTWIKDDDKTIRIRPDDWAFRRSCEIPESFLAHYRDILDKQGYLALDDAAAMIGSLTDDQIRVTLSDDWPLLIALDGMAQDAPEEHEMLRAYASFTAEQKALLNSDAGMPLSQLTDEQWAHVGTIISDQMNGSYVADGSIRLLPQTDKQIQARELTRLFEIRTQVGDEKEPRKLNVYIVIPSIDKVAAGMAQYKRAVEAALKAAEPAAAK